MKVGERGQVTIPKDIRERYGIDGTSEVVFKDIGGAIFIQKKGKRLQLEKWAGRYRDRLAELGYDSTDEFIEAVRGR